VLAVAPARNSGAARPEPVKATAWAHYDLIRSETPTASNSFGVFIMSGEPGTGLQNKDYQNLVQRAGKRCKELGALVAPAGHGKQKMYQTAFCG
jgi:hypothetical protein